MKLAVVIEPRKDIEPGDLMRWLQENFQIAGTHQSTPVTIRDNLLINANIRLKVI